MSPLGWAAAGAAVVIGTIVLGVVAFFGYVIYKSLRGMGDM